MDNIPGFSNFSTIGEKSSGDDSVFIRTIPVDGSNVRSSEGLNKIQSLNSENLRNIGSISRMATNSTQGVSPGATPQSLASTRAVTLATTSSSGSSGATDWRVSLLVPSEISGSSILSPFGQTGKRMIFPYNPTVFLSQRASYTHVQPVHTNHTFNAYQNSTIDDIQIAGDFFVENEEDAKYWIACVHFLRTMTKMFYGDNGENTGKPPMLSRLNGYGKHVLNDIPVLISNFTIDMPQDVDYISCKVNGEPNHVPVRSTITVVCTPNYSRRTASTFNLTDFANGKLVNNGQGFV